MDRFKAFLKSKCFMYVLLLLLCLFFACLSDNYDYDLYARLIVGESFVEKGIFHYRDFLSYTPTHLWYDHEWGSGVVFYWFLKLFGSYGLILVHALTMFVTAFFIIKTQKLQKHAYPTSILFMGLFLLLFSHLNPNIVRCHMFSFMFFAMFLYFLEKTRTQNSNIIWLVPLIVIIWNNLHGGVVSGLGIIFIYMVCAILTAKSWKKYFYVLLVSTPLLAINPYGIEYLDFLFSANTKNRKYITEWWPVFAKRHVYYYYPAFCTGIFTIIIAGINAFKRKNFDLTKFSVLVVTTLLGTIHVKLLSLAIIVVGALFYNDLMGIFCKKQVKILEKLTYILISISLIYIPLSYPFTPRVSVKKFPVLEVEFLRKNQIEGNIITGFGLGSYVSYKLYPQNLIYMDGRYEEVYYDQEIENLAIFELAEPNWEKITKIYPTDILMPNKSVPIFKALKDSPNWDLVYEGPLCGVFLRKGKHKENYKLPSKNLRYYQKTAFNNMGKFRE